MKPISAPLLGLGLLALLATAPALATAASFTVDFEKPWDYLDGDVNGYYSGGTAADGSSGANLGVSFVGVSGLSNDVNFTAFSGAPSPQGVAYAHTFAPGDVAVMNVAGGVSQALSFWYSAPTAATGAVKAYSGLNGSGTLLGSIDLAANSSAAYDHWTRLNFSYAGTAHSFDLSGSANNVALDNISAVPEPASLLMLLAGGVAVLRQGARRRR